MKYSQKYILSKQLRDKFNRLYIKLIKDSEKDSDVYNELLKVYEDF